MSHPLDIDVFSLHTALVADPGAGSQFSFACPANARIEILGVNYLSTTAAAGTARLHILQIDTGGNKHSIVTSRNVQTAGNASTYSFTKGLGIYAGTITLRNAGESLPLDFFLEPGDSLESDHYSWQLFDAMTAIRIRYKLWHIGTQ